MRKKKAEAESPAVTRETGPSGSEAGRLTPIDIQQIEFRRAFKGYEEREVDEFLDRLTEDFAAALDETQRLRRRLDATQSSSLGAPDLGDVSRQADEIIQRARDEAAAMIRDAEARAATAGPIGSADRAAIGAFLSKEKEFLQSLASLVQGHAEGVKGMAASARERSSAAPSPRKASAVPTDEGSSPQGPAGSGASGDTPPTSTQPMAPVPSGSEARGRIEIPEAEATVERAQAARAQGKESERSLRELFWGEE
jgi:DivIVA domain-containing protein